MVSEDGAQQVLSQLERHGYFLNHNAPEVQADDSFEAYQQGKLKQQEDTTPSETSRYLIPTTTTNSEEGSCFTPIGLVRHLLGRLQDSESSGRASLSELCSEARVDCQLFLEAPPKQEAVASISLWDRLIKEAESSNITILGTNKRGAIQGVELVSAAYWERTLEEIIEMVENQGTVSISTVMTTFSLSRETILSQLIGNEALERIGGRMMLMNDSKELVSTSQYDLLRQKVLKHFSGVNEPVQIHDICQEEGWDGNQVLEWLASQLEHQDETSELYLPGEIHADSSTCGQTAMYLPISYRQKQQEEILEFLSANGYITMARAVRNYNHGLLATQITELVTDSFPGVTILNEGTVFVAEQTLQQVQVGVQDYLSSTTPSLLDLEEYLPEELLQSPTTVQNILDTIGFTSPSEGVAVMGNDRAILASKEAIKHFKDNHLSQLLQKHAKNRASEIFQLQFALEEEEDDNEDVGGKKSGKSTKSRRKAKNSKQNKKKDKQPKGDASSFVIPLVDVTLAVIDAFSDFQDDSLSPDEKNSLQWEDEDDLGLPVQFCRKALYTDSLLEQCQRAVNAELQRLESEKNSKARMSRKDAAAKVRSVEAAFQDAFVTLCYLLQAQAKAIAHFENLEDFFDEGSIELLRDELQKGPCADLTSRITQHCLFQEEAQEDCLFTFVKSTNNIEETEQSSSLPRYCSDVTITSCRHPESYLSCAPPREPLPVLRESFSGNVGIVLAKMWILCGGECYRGGVRTIDDEGGTGSQILHVRPGSMDGFLSYAEENCLTLCGLPYKKLDKKVEKSLLFSRKQQLNGLLASTDATTDPTKVLEYTIMILFQQVRSLIVSGSLLRGPILEALSTERKIPSSVAAALKLLNEMIENDSGSIDQTLVSLVKECGLVRDINKHDTMALESFLADN